MEPKAFVHSGGKRVDGSHTCDSDAERSFVRSTVQVSSPVVHSWAVLGPVHVLKELGASQQGRPFATRSQYQKLVPTNPAPRMPRPIHSQTDDAVPSVPGISPM